MSSHDQGSAIRLFARPMLLVVAAAVSTAIDTGLALALLVAAALTLVLGIFVPKTLARIDRVIAKIGSAAATFVATSIGLVAWILFVLPLWILNHLVGFRPLATGASPQRSQWLPVAIGHGREDPQKIHRRTAGASPSLSLSMHRRGTVRRLVVLLLVGASAALIASGKWADLDFWKRGDIQAHADNRAQSTEGGLTDAGPAVDASREGEVAPKPNEKLEWDGKDVSFAFEGEPWAGELLREQDAGFQIPDQILGTRNTEFRGKYVNMRNGTRDTWTPPHPEITVWYFGGSTMFGLGQRDNNTIPSVVAKLAAKDKIRIRSINYGVSADVNWIETIRFAELISSGIPAPDLIVFYDGVNEFGVGFERAESGDRVAAHSARKPVTAEEHRELLERSRSAPPLSGTRLGETANKLSATQYRRGVLVARALAKERGIPIIHFWQPQPLSRRVEDADRRLYKTLDFNVNDLPGTTEQYENVRRNSGVDPIDLSRTLDGVKGAVYMDGSHTNERGARIIGEAMYRKLKPKLKALQP